MSARSRELREFVSPPIPPCATDARPEGCVSASAVQLTQLTRLTQGTAPDAHPDAASDIAVDLQEMPDYPDDDALTTICPACGCAAEWPDCEACGFEFEVGVRP